MLRSRNPTLRWSATIIYLFVAFIYLAPAPYRRFTAPSQLRQNAEWLGGLVLEVGDSGPTRVESVLDHDCLALREVSMLASPLTKIDSS